MPTELRLLRSMSLEQLEALFAHDEPVQLPRGTYRGHFIAWLDHPGARRKRWRWPQRAVFEWAAFGIDFDRSLWFFFRPSLAVGRFDARLERSRWRETSSVGMHYEPSRLPGFVRDRLYDEVKPLPGGLLLGLGGINAGPGRGDHFFFALRPVG